MNYLNMAITRKLLAVFLIAVFVPVAFAASSWTALGPEGGDVRSLAYDPANPDHIILGTSTGVLYASHDAGRSWTRFAHLGTGDDYVLDHVVFDPQNSKKIYVSAWSFQNQQEGDVFRSHDGGKNWEALPTMHNKSVRALAISASDSKFLVAGALDGVYRSKDGGNSWERISPPNHADIKNVESIAVDPSNPDVVYAGTWHLAWKTANGGATWEHINKGMIDDSDVFSIIVDKTNPSIVFASACSGIYKSETAGGLFKKIQGIPFSARRTRVLKQDPSNASIVYAGTTEGLWKSLDLGKTWKRVSGPEVVVNDVLVDPRNSQHVLLATDRMGVLTSSDGTQTFTSSNQGFSHRFIAAIEPDHSDPKTIYVGLINDQELGGVYVSTDGGAHWKQRSAGLTGRDVYTLKQASNGTLVAGTNRGMFLLEKGSATWRPSNTVVSETSATKVIKVKGKTRRVASHSTTRSVLNARVNDIEIAPNRWLAATSSGLYTSSDQGKIWTGGPVMGKQDFVAVRSNHEMVVAATRSGVVVSTDGGTSWNQAPLTSFVSSVYGLAITPDSDIFVASREGVMHSADAGKTWERMVNGVPTKDIGSITYDPERKRLLATSSTSSIVFESSNNGRSWQRHSDAGYTLRSVSAVRGRLLAATPFDGVVAQPENDSRSAAAEGAGGAR